MTSVATPIGTPTIKFQLIALAAVLATGADTIFLVGPSMAALGDALGEGGIAAYAQSVDAIEKRVLDSLAYGDAVMVKGSKGVRLAGLVRQIREKFQ